MQGYLGCKPINIMLLSRVAESLYWINRYLERAENISRFVEVSESMALDCPPGSAEPWLPLVLSLIHI